MCELSVIIPVYNGKKYIEKNVDELMKIKHSKELIIIDDGSNDDSYLFCKKKWEDSGIVKIYKQNNAGIVSARNNGLFRAKGKYIIFVDQDDIVVPSTIDFMINQMDRFDAGVGFWETKFKYEDGKEKVCDKISHEKFINDVNEMKKVVSSVLLNKTTKYFSYLGHVWSGMYKREIIEKKEIFFKKFIDYEDDYLFIIDILIGSPNCLFIPRTGYYWSVNLESYSHTNKYVKNYLVKSENLSEYIFRVAEQYGVSCYNRIRDYWKQSTIIKSIRNAGSGSKVDYNEIRLIKDRMQRNDYREAFKNKLLLEKDFRFKIIYVLVKMKLYKMAVYIVMCYYKMMARNQKYNRFIYKIIGNKII